MRTEEENSIDQLLKQLKPTAAPDGFELKIMQQVAGLKHKPVNTFSMHLHQYLLAVSLGAVAVAVYLMVSGYTLRWQFSGIMFDGSGWLQAELQSINALANTLSHIPVLVWITLAITGALLIIERMILGRKSRTSFVFLL